MVEGHILPFFNLCDMLLQFCDFLFDIHFIGAVFLQSINIIQVGILCLFQSLLCFGKERHINIQFIGCRRTKEYDPSRLVNPASGGNHYTCGDILDLHHYPGPNMFLYDPRRATVLGEYGGIGLVVEGNTWVNDKKNWGYVKFNTSDEVTNEYIKYGKHLLELIRKGFSAAVYTQTTDVEGEINGLMTYDRKVIKMNEAKVREINQQICNSLNK